MRDRKGLVKVQCDITGAIVRARDCRMTWDGKFVHKSAWTPRHPQETPLIVSDSARPAVTRPISEPVIIDPESVTGDDL